MYERKRFVLFDWNTGWLALCFFMMACTSQIPESKQPALRSTKEAVPVVHMLDTMPTPKVSMLKDLPSPGEVKLPGGFIKENTPEAAAMDQQKGPLPPVASEMKPPYAHFTQFTVRDGSYLSIVNTTYEDKRGILWFGTSTGACSYNGIRFTNYSAEQGLEGSDIRNITEDASGNLWFTTAENGVNKYDGVRFTNYSKANGLPDNTVFDVVNDKKNRLWFATWRGGISVFDGRSFTNFDTSSGLPNNNVNDLEVDDEGQLWMATIGGGVCMYNGRGFHTLTERDGLADNRVIKVRQDTKGNIWLATFRGISKIDREKVRIFGNGKMPEKIFSDQVPKQAIAKSLITSLTEDKDGRIWFGTLGDGVSCFDPNQQNGSVDLQTLTTDQGLAHNAIHDIYVDREGFLWISTDGNGISRLNGTRLKFFKAGEGLLPVGATDIMVDSESRLWLTDRNFGISSFDGKTKYAYSSLQGLPDNRIYRIMEDTINRYWISTFENGVSIFEPSKAGNSGKLKTFSEAQGLIQHTTVSVMKDDQRNYWIGSWDRGLTVFDGKRMIQYTTKEGLAGLKVYDFLQTRDRKIWIATLDSGISVYDGRSFSNYTTAQGLPNNWVYKLLEDKNGYLWIGTGSGISRFDGHRFLNFDIPPDEGDDYVYDIVEDSQGVIWMGTQAGLTSLKFRPSKSSEKNAEPIGAGRIKLSNDSLEFFAPVWEQFSLKTGYPITDVDALVVHPGVLASGALKDSGLIWGCCTDGTIFCMNPYSTKPRSNNALNLYIQKVDINESPQNWYALSKGRYDSVLINRQEVSVFGSRLKKGWRDSIRHRFERIRFDSISPFYQVPVNLVLPYANNRLDIEFGAVETHRHFMVRYQYMLVGYDREWSPVTEKRIASYGNIPEGRYQFLVKAMAPNGVWTEPVSFLFRVSPPWWRTWWMYLFYVAFAGGIVYAASSLRSASLRRANRSLEQKIQHRTSQLEKSLTDLKSTQAQLIQSEKMASLGELTAGIAHEIQNPLNFVNNFSDLNQELIDELKEELNKGDVKEAAIIAESLKENESKINLHGRRADSIVKSMLQHSRSSGGHKEPTDINKLVDEYVRLAYHGFRAKYKDFNVKLDIDLDPNLPRIPVVAQDIGRVILNLLNNAFQAVQEKAQNAGAGYQPTVSIQTNSPEGVPDFPEGDPGLRPKGHPPGNLPSSTIHQPSSIIIRVADNGPGIPDNIKDKIFQPFFTTKPTGQGTGLGLSLSYDIIKAHGGEITANVGDDSGVAFRLSLPAS